MAAKLEIKQRRYEYNVVWLVDGEEGAVIGQDGTLSEKDLSKKLSSARRKKDDGDQEPDYFAAEAAAKKLATERPLEFYYHEMAWTTASYGAAKDLLRVCRAAVKAEKLTLAQRVKGKPLPAWAQKALAEGWKAPKGWAP